MQKILRCTGKTAQVLITALLAFLLVCNLYLIIMDRMSVFAPLLAPYDPLAVDMKNALSGPSGEHLLGTDNIGRDLLSRVIYGGRQSMVLAAVATGQPDRKESSSRMTSSL